MGKRLLPPWKYPHDTIPSRWTLRDWRRKALEMARKAGFLMCCGICKRPVRSWGFIHFRHPASYGKTRHRKICRTCANLVIHMLDVLEWHLSCENLPETLTEGKRPEDVPDSALAAGPDLAGENRHGPRGYDRQPRARRPQPTHVPEND